LGRKVSGKVRGFGKEELKKEEHSVRLLFFFSYFRFGKVKGLERLKIWKRLERLKVLKGRSPRIQNLGHIKIIDNYYSRLDTSNWA
jgi:hypothetical protein